MTPREGVDPIRQAENDLTNRDQTVVTDNPLHLAACSAPPAGSPRTAR